MSTRLNTSRTFILGLFIVSTLSMLSSALSTISLVFSDRSVFMVVMTALMSD